MKNKWMIFIAMAAFGLISSEIDLSNLDHYADQPVPNYITKDNSPTANPISDKGATLGRVLFYDKHLSANNKVACASCHKQQFAFGDTATLSSGLNGGLTGRHSMRLVNTRFADEVKFFWNERAASLEDQTTMPIRDHTEMGFSGTNGDPDFNDLIQKLNDIPYYKDLFEFVYGDSNITEERIQDALAQFVRSIQSFDSRYDMGRSQVNNDRANFPNFTPQENLGKTLFLDPPPQGGAGCQGCHRAPEFDIDPNSRNNGVIAIAGSNTEIDLTNTKAPSLRNLFNSNGTLNTPLMHNGNFTDIMAVVNHYNSIVIDPRNNNLDNRLVVGGGGPGGRQGQQLNLSQNQKEALVAFLKTLTGSNIYSDSKWSNPFDENGNLTLLPLTTGIRKIVNLEATFYPNPVHDYLQINLAAGNYRLNIYNQRGQLLKSDLITGNNTQQLASFPNGMLIVEITDIHNSSKAVRKIIKN